MSEAFEVSAATARQFPESLVARFVFGRALYDQDAIEPARKEFDAVLAAQPWYGPALYYAIKTRVEEGDLTAAVALHSQVRECVSDLTFLPSLAAALLPETPRSESDMNRARESYEAAVRSLADVNGEIRESGVIDLPTNFIAAYQGHASRPFQEIIAQFYARVCPELSYRAPPQPGAERHRIRVGFVSNHLYNHTVGKLTRGFVAEFDRARFEVMVFTMRAAEDEIGRFIAERSDAFVILPRDLAEARATIAAAAPDVVFYPDIGMEPFTYFLAFSRLAPVQCVGWGHPITTGIATVDYFISSREFEPDGAVAQNQYTEKLVQLSPPSVYLYPPRFSERESKLDLSFASARTIYACVQAHIKMHPDFDRLLFDILRSDPRGIALFIESTPRLTAILRARFQRGAFDLAHRIHFIPRLGQNEFLDLLNRCHVLLDTIHFSGGISSAEAFSLGKAVVTWPHPFLMPGRITYGCYRQLGVEACVARDFDDYVAKAVRLGTDAPYRAEVEAAIRAGRDRLFGQATVVRELESFFEDAVVRARINRSMS